MACGLLLGCPTGNGEPAADTSEPAAGCQEVPVDECGAMVGNTAPEVRLLGTAYPEATATFDPVTLIPDAAALDQWCADNQYWCTADQFDIDFETEQGVGTFGYHEYAGTTGGAWVASFSWSRDEASLVAVVTMNQHCPTNDGYNPFVVSLWATPLVDVSSCELGTKLSW